MRGVLPEVPAEARRHQEEHLRRAEMGLTGRELHVQRGYLVSRQGLDELERMGFDGVVVEARLNALDRPHQWVHLDRVLRATRRTRLLQDRQLVLDLEDSVAAPHVAKNGGELVETECFVRVESSRRLSLEQQFVERSLRLDQRELVHRDALRNSV